MVPSLHCFEVDIDFNIEQVNTFNHCGIILITHKTIVLFSHIKLFLCFIFLAKNAALGNNAISARRDTVSDKL